MKKNLKVTIRILMVCLLFFGTGIVVEAKDYYYKNQKLKLPASILRADGCFAVSEKNCRYLPGVTCEYAAQTSCVKVKSQNHTVTIFADKKKIFTDGKKKTLSIRPKELYEKKECVMLVPFEELLEALSIRMKWSEDGKKCNLSKKKVVFAGKKKYTTYPSFASYSKKEFKKNYQASYQVYKRLLSPSKDKTQGFQFMTLDTYRPVDTKRFLGYVDNEIEAYCKINKISPRNSVLYGKGKALLAAAKKYRIDPLYFACQTFLESAYGTSILAKGKKIGKKKYYNLYGIKAYDKNPQKHGFNYAKKQGWNTVKKALCGGAKYLSTGYVHGKYKQNTLYKIRFLPGKAIWHQYASDPYYAEKIGKKMYEMSVCYAEGSDYIYDYPRFR